MNKYRRKPVVIEGRRWMGGVEEATTIIDWVLAGGHTARFHSHAYPRGERIAIGADLASPGDWILKGASGEFYTCKPRIFEQIYEEVT